MDDEEVASQDHQHGTPSAFDVFSTGCDSRSVLSEVTGRWGALTLVALMDQPRRFAELRRRVGGISERMLSQTLHALEADGLISRTVHSQIPPHVEYDLTSLGQPLAARLAAVIATIYDLMPDLLNHREQRASLEPR